MIHFGDVLRHDMIRARSWRDSAPDLAVEFVSLLEAFFSHEATPEEIAETLVARGVSTIRAQAIAAHYKRLTGDL